MAADIKFTADMAGLAEAAYALFDSSKTTQKALVDSGFSDAQATTFVANWAVIDHLPDDPESDFSATLFKSNVSGEFTLAFRGTAGIVDDLLYADLGDIVLDGLAVDQIIDMYNYYQRLTHAGSYEGVALQLVVPPAELGKSLNEYALENGLLYLKGLPGADLEVGNVYKIVPASFTDGIGVISISTPLHVTGHSLGGHLAAAFSRLFSNATTDVTMINGAGFSSGDPLIANNFNVTNLFSMLEGASEFPSDKITNYIGSGITVVAQDTSIGLKQPGGMTTVEIESHVRSTLGHGAGQMTDSLAVMSMLWQLDNTLSIAQLNQLLLEVSSDASRALETVVNTVATVFGYNTIADDADNSGPGREAFYAALDRIQSHLDSIEVESHFSITLLGGRAGTDIARLAGNADDASTPENLAVRFALNELSAFAIVGYDYDSDVLSIYNPETGEGSLTQEWITDRSNMLAALITKWTISENQQVTDFTAKDGFDYQDLASGQEVLVLPDPFVAFQPLVHRVYFGSNGAETLDGNKGNDRLYGMAGDDILNGEAGQDYLEGGTGDDVLKGGRGSDTLMGGRGNDRYEFATGDGNDTLSDIDGVGELWIDGIRYSVGKQPAADADSWISDDGKVRFVRSGSDLLVLYGRGDSVLVQGYSSDALGLALETFQPAAVPQNTAHMGSDNPDQLDGTQGDDLILGLGGGDSILENVWGTDHLGGNDTLVGGAGSDRLFGGAGNDRIHAYELGEQGPANPLGSNGKGITGDWLDGREGDDLLVGSGGQDGLFGGAGADTLVGGGGDDFIFADTTTSNLMPDLFLKLSTIAIGEDYEKVASVSAIGKAPLGGLGGNDVVFAGEGNDFVDGYAGDDYIEGNAGEDYLGGSMGNDTLLGGAGNDTLVGDGFDGLAPALPSARIPGHLHGNDFLVGGEGADLIQGNGGDDRLFGDEGNDTLYGDDLTTPAEYHGNDLLVGGAGNDTLRGGGRDDTLLGGLGNDILEGDYTDTPEAYQGADLLDGGAGSDTLLGYGGNDTLRGGEGIDYLSGGTGDNLLDGGAGDDVLEAATGNDRYVFNRGYGNDSVYDKGGRNVVEFGVGFSPDSLEVDVVSLSGGDWLYLSANGDTLHLHDYQKWANSSFRFADGRVLSFAQMMKRVRSSVDASGSAEADVLYGSDNDDTLIGGLGDDLLTGQGGADILAGGAGNDTYVFGLGDGDDMLADDQGDNVVRFGEGIDRGSLGFAERYNASGARVLEVTYSGGSVAILGGFTGAVSRFEFADGSTLSLAEALDSLPDIDLPADDNGSDGADTLVGGGGNDVPDGQDNDNEIRGGDGNDTLRGTTGDDFLVGGAGIDLLYGRKGEDTYIVTDEVGEDIIADFVPVERLTNSFVSVELPLLEYHGEVLEEKDTVVLPDGVALDRLEMSWGQVLIEGVYMNRLIAGRALPGEPGDRYQARMAYTTLDISWGSDQTVRVVMPHANDPQGTGVELFRFADGTTLALSELLAHGNLGEMPDPYLLGANLESDGDVSEYDRHLDNAIPLAGGIGNDTLTGSGKLEGWDGDDVLTGRETNDVLNGGRGADTLIGGGGNDYLGMVFDEYYSEGNTYIGGTGNDTLFGSQDADTYRFTRGDGQDLITDLHRIGHDRRYSALDIRYGGPKWSGMPDEMIIGQYQGWKRLLSTPPTYTGRDTLELGEGIAPADVTYRFEGHDLLLEFGHGDSIRFENWLLHEEKPLKEVVFADGTVWGEERLDQWYPSGTPGDDLIHLGGGDDSLSGLRGNDTLYGYGGNDWLAGGPGDDRLYGGVGNDDLHGASGEDWLYGEEGNDTLVGGAGADTLEGGMGDDLYHADSFDTLIEYADGGTDTVMTSDSWTLEENFENLVLVGNAAAEITGNDLDNRLRGNDADNYLTGGRGADLLWGRGGNDVLDGGAGNDTLVGGLGNDAYVFRHGDGNDVIVENDSTTGNQDGVMFYTSIDVEKLWFRQVDQDLEIQLSGTTDSLLIRDWYKGSAHHVERFDSADGRTLLDSQVQNLVDAMAAFGAPAGGLSSLPDTQRMQLETVIAANWH